MTHLASPKEATMGREKDRLSDKAVKAKKKRGRYSDSGGLYLHITKLGYKSWEYRFRIRGKLRTMGLGSYPKVSLKEARIKRDDARKLRDNNIDPIIARGSMRQIAAASLTVDQAAEAYVAVMEKEWKTKRYASQIRARLETYVKPVIGHLPIADIGLAEIKQVLVPIWTNKRPTANRIRKHLEGAINWAIAEGHRTDESNPAEVKRLQFSLSFAERKVTHYPSLPYSEAPSFLAELRKQDGVKARALEFVMLTAVRVADICGGGKEHAVPMLWSHVDMPGQTWTIPDTKMGNRTSCRSQRSGHDAARRDAARSRSDNRLRVSWREARHGDQRCHAALSASGHGLCRHRHHPRIPRHVPHLGVGDHRLRQRRDRDLPGPRARRTGFGLPPWVISRQAPSPDGCVGRLLR